MDKMATMVEIDSFMSKFKHLLNNRFKATMTFEADNGEAINTLKAGLGSSSVVSSPMIVQTRGSYSLKQRSPSYFRRQERRRLKRQVQNAGAEEALDTAAIPVLEEKLCDRSGIDAAKANEQALSEEVVHCEVVKEENANKNFSAKQVDTDLYTFIYWDKLKKSVPKEAVDYVTKKLQSRFRMDNIENFNQKIDVCGVARSSQYENEIAVKVKLKKNASHVEKAARTIQIPWSKEFPIALVLKSIDRG